MFFPFRFRGVFFYSLFFLIIVSMCGSVACLLFTSGNALLTCDITIGGDVGLGGKVVSLFSVKFTIYALDNVTYF